MFSLFLMFNIPTLKLHSLFATRRFWTFHNKSHNMKALVIPSRSWSQFLSLTCLYGKNEPLWVFVCSFGVFSREKKLPPDYPCKSHDHDHQWTGLIMVWLPKDKRKCEHKVVRLVWEFYCLHFTLYMPLSPHSISYKQTWYPPDVR